jgi:predicted acyl esterase
MSRPSLPSLSVLSLTLAAAAATFASIAHAQTAPMAADIPGTAFATTVPNADYALQEVMIPMRDGVKLHTVIVVPNSIATGSKAPIMLTRTPYNASGRAGRMKSPHLASILGDGDDAFIENGYIRVFQDVRGKYGSEGDYVMTRPVRGPLNNTPVDHSTDAYDTIDWLVKNVPQSNGKVGMVGSSYEGFTVLMALVEPHPALKAAVPMSPMVDGWRGDDWFHNGAFRNTNLAYIASQTAARGKGEQIVTGVNDDYDAFLRAGSTGDFAHAYGVDQLNYVKKLFEHPAYDSYWQEQALDRILARRPLTVPTMTVVGRWDQTQFAGGGPVAPQRRELRRLHAGAAALHRRHRPAIPARRDAALLQSISEGWRAGLRHAAGVVVPDRREPLAPSGTMAAGAGIDAAVPETPLRPGVRQERRQAG